MLEAWFRGKNLDSFVGPRIMGKGRYSCVGPWLMAKNLDSWVGTLNHKL